MFTEIRSVTEMCIRNVAKQYVALDDLYAIESSARAYPVPQIASDRHHMKCQKERHERPLQRRYTNPPNPLWTGIFELHRKHREIVFVAQSSHDREVAFADRVIRGDDVVEQRN